MEEQLPNQAHTKAYQYRLALLPIHPQKRIKWITLYPDHVLTKGLIKGQMLGLVICGTHSLECRPLQLVPVSMTIKLTNRHQH